MISVSVSESRVARLTTNSVNKPKTAVDQTNVCKLRSMVDKSTLQMKS